MPRYAGGAKGKQRPQRAARAAVEGLEGRILLSDSMFAPQVNYLTGGMSTIASGDFNHDGNIDLVGSDRNGWIKVMRGRGDGTFDALPCWSAGYSVASVKVGSFDADAKPDLAVVSGQHIAIWAGQGDGTFQLEDDMTGEPACDVEVADLDGDGLDDLVTANLSGGVSVLLGKGDGTFARTDYKLPQRSQDLALADFNSDGVVDVAATLYGSAEVAVMLGQGDGTLGASTVFKAAEWPTCIGAGDLNGDGTVDLAVGAGNQQGLSILFGNGDGTFMEKATVVTSGNITDASIADFNGDGLVDVALATGAATDRLLWGTGGGTFNWQSAYPADLQSASLAVADFNQDGKPDIASGDVGAGGSWGLSLLLNTSTKDLPPRIGGMSKTTRLNAPVPFIGDDFASIFQDPNADDRLQAVRVESLPTHGTLSLGGAAVAVSQVIASGDLSSLVYAPSAGYLGPDAFTWRGSDGLVFSDAATVSLQVILLSPRTDYPVGGGAYKIASGDFDKDGFLDVVVAGGDQNTLSILRGDGAGGFGSGTSYVVSDSPVGVQVADWDGDGNLDLISEGMYADGVSILLGRGDGTFQAPQTATTGHMPRDPVFGDFNQDGKLDIVTADYASGTLSVLLGDGHGGTLSRGVVSVGSYPGGLAVGDFDRDGNLDLAVNSFDFLILLGDGKGGFRIAATLPTFLYHSEVAAEDLNGDGKLDLVVLSGGLNFVSVMLGDGNGNFSPRRDFPAGNWGDGLSVADLTGDGRLDLVITNAYTSGSNVLRLLPGNGDGTFGTSLIYNAGSFPSSLVTGDFNSDGKVDVVTVDNTQRNLCVLLNVSPADFVPEVEVEPVASPQRGDVAVQYRLTDAEAASCNIVAEYSVDSGRTWHRATARGGDAATSGLAISPAGTTHTFLWYSTNDIGTSRFGSVLLKITADDAAGTGWAISSPFAIDDAPSATVVLSRAVAHTDDVLIATATKSDPNGDPVTLTFLWRVNGAVKRTLTSATALTDSFDLATAGNGNKGDVVSVKVIPNDGLVDGASANSQAEITNSAPALGAISQKVAQGGTLNLGSDPFTTAFHDSDPGDRLENVLITKLPAHGALTLGETAVAAGQVIAADQLAALSYVGDAGYSGTDSFCWAASDGSVYSAAAPATIRADAPPTVSVSLSSQTPGTAEVLTATATKSDADGEAVSVTFVWKVNGVEKRRFTSSSALSDSFSLGTWGNGDKGDQVTVEVVGSDGYLQSDAASDTAVVTNSAPTVSGFSRRVYDAPATFAAWDFISRYGDADADNLQMLRITSGPSHGTLRLGETDVTAGQDIAASELDTLRYVPDAGYGGSDTFGWMASDGSQFSQGDALVTLAINRRPTVGVTLDKRFPGTGEVLTARATTSDPDGDTVGVTFVWKVNGVIRRSYRSLWADALTDTFDLSLAGNGDAGDTVTVEVTGSDAYLDSAPASDSVTIAPHITPTIYLYSPRPDVRYGEDVPVKVLVASDEPGPWPTGTVTLADDNGRVLGTARLTNGEASFTLHGLAKGSHQLVATYSGCGQYPSVLHNYATSLAINVAARSIVDVLAIYTPAAVRMSAGRGEGIQQQITSAVGDTNQAFLNSRIDASLNLVGAAQINYVESGSFMRDLDRLANPRDGYLDSVQALRQEYGADLVVLFVGRGDMEGLAYVMQQLTKSSNPNKGFSVVMADDTDPAAPTHLLAHELGHNFGAAHDRPHVDARGMYSDSYGYRYTGSDGVLYHDIMSYDPGQVIPYYANPAVAYKGAATGKKGSSDVARTINLSAPVVAKYQPTKVPLVTATQTRLSMSGSSSAVRITARVSGIQGNPHLPAGTVTFLDGERIIGTAILRNGVATWHGSLATPGKHTVRALYRSSAYFGDSLSAALAVNAAPTTAVSLNTHAPGTNAQLRATATKSDLDGDPVSLTFVWRVNGVIQRSFTSATVLSDTFSLARSGHGDGGDRISVEVTAWDEKLASRPATDVAVVTLLGTA